MHDKRGKFNQLLHTARHTLSPSSCTHFSPSILKLLWQTASLPLESFCWNPISSLMLYSWGCKPLEISDSASIPLNLHLEYMITSHLNTYYFIPTTITTINQGLNSFKCMIRRASLTCLYRWHSAGILSAHWCYTAEAINHTKISDFASISLNLHNWVHDYFTSK